MATLPTELSFADIQADTTLWEGRITHMYLDTVAKVTVGEPLDSPSWRSVSPGPWPACIGARSMKFGKAKVDWPFPPYVVPSNEKSAVFCAIESNCPLLKS